MPQVSIFKVLQKTISSSTTTTFLLLDKQQQRLLALQLREHTSDIPLQTSSSVPAEPLTGDFLANVLHALGGTLEETAIDALPNEHLYAHLHLRDQRGLHSVNASLDDALRLAQHEQSRISVSEDILARRAVNLADYGATEEESLAEISRRTAKDPYSVHPPTRELLNLDFSNDLRGWHFFRDSTYGSYALDPQTPLMDKTSLAITLHKPFTHGSSGILFYSFRASQYRGQRVRLSAYVKTEQMSQPDLEFDAIWSTGKISPLTGTDAGASCLTHSRIVPHASDSSWVRHEMVIDVPAQAHSLSFKLGTFEQGKLWLAGLECVSVDRSVPLTGTILRPPPAQPVNLDFSEGLEYWETEGASSGRYEVAVETTAPVPSVTLKSVVEAPAGSCILQQKLILENYRGKIVRLTATLKTRDVASHALLFISSYLIGEEDRVEQALTGTADWTPYTLDWQAPTVDQGLFVFGISLQGPGQLWMRDIHLQIVEV